MREDGLQTGGINPPPVAVVAEVVWDEIELLLLRRAVTGVIAGVKVVVKEPFKSEERKAR